MNRGKIIQDGPPVSVYSRPRNTFVARFLGFNNLVPAHVPANAPDTIQTPIGHFAGFPENQSLAPGRHILLLRPDGAHLIAMPDTTVTPGIHLGTNGDIPERTKIVLVGQLIKKWYHGDRYRVEVAVPVTDYQFESLGQSDGERGTAGTNRPGFLHLQFELMVLHAAAEHGYRSPTSLPEMGSDICLRLHPAQLVLLPPT